MITRVSPKRVGQFSVLYVMAADAEYGPSLKKLFNPMICGVGPVESAISIANALSGLSGKVDLVVSLGSAGSRLLEQTSVYQASSVSYRDMDASPLGFEKGVTPFLGQPAEISLNHQIVDVPSARLSTGANIVSGDMYDGIDADMVDMESYAVMRACQIHDVALICLRGISDGADELKHINDWTQYLGIIDSKLADVVELLERQIVSGELIL